MSKKAAPDFGDDSGPALHSARWRFGDFELDESRRELHRSGELVSIEPRPLNLLMLLLRHPGEVITKNDLIESLWGTSIVVDAALSNCVAKLRAALGEDLSGFIKTVHGFGYRCDIEAADTSDERAANVAPTSISFNAADSVPLRPNWQLVRRLGNSGDCWLVEHAKTRDRRVFKFTTEPRGLSALKREVTIYRLLRESLGDKVCYVNILDWNFDEPPFFIESEYCPGGSLQEWFDAQGGIAKVPLATRLNLIAQIAEALAEVHLVGVLHKDLKPANVFVVIGPDNQPKIRLADFGAGRLLEPERLAALEITRQGFTQFIDDKDIGLSGTLLYLAPEVLNGHPATVKADIYALGVMLYQFVVGNLRRQLTPGWEAEVFDEILRDDIASAADGNPERRLADAGELARNLRSIEARRSTREADREALAKAERAARAMDRMKARRVGLIAAFAALAAGFVVSAYLYVEASKARDIAQAETRRAEKVADFLGKDMFKAVNTDDHPVKDLTVKQLLDTASAEVENRFKDEPDIAATVLESLGRSFRFLGYTYEAEANLSRALKIHELASGQSSNDAIRLTSQVIGLAYPVGKLPDTIQHYAETLKLAEVRLGASDPDVLKLKARVAEGWMLLGQWSRSASELAGILATLDLSPVPDRPFQSQIVVSLGYVKGLLADYAGAEFNYRRCITLNIELRGSEHLSVADCRAWLGRTLAYEGRFDEAVVELTMAGDSARKWGDEKSESLWSINFYQAETEFLRGHHDAAIALIKPLLPETPDDPQNHFDQSFHVTALMARVKDAQGNRLEAERYMRSAESSSNRTLGVNHPTSIGIALELIDLIRKRTANPSSDLLKLVPVGTLNDLPGTHPYVKLYQRLASTLAEPPLQSKIESTCPIFLRSADFINTGV